MTTMIGCEHRISAAFDILHRSKIEGQNATLEWVLRLLEERIEQDQHSVNILHWLDQQFTLQDALGNQQACYKLDKMIHCFFDEQVHEFSRRLRLEVLKVVKIQFDLDHSDLTFTATCFPNIDRPMYNVAFGNMGRQRN